MGEGGPAFGPLPWLDRVLSLHGKIFPVVSLTQNIGDSSNKPTGGHLLECP